MPANDRVGSSFGQKQSDRGPARSHAQGAYVLSVLELVCCLHNTVIMMVFRFKVLPIGQNVSAILAQIRGQI